MINKLIVAMGAIVAMPGFASAQYAGWQHSGSIAILTTPDGANLPASAAEEDVPVLVRLHKDFFDFSQAKPGGEDLRFSADGKPLVYQIDKWDAAQGTAGIWVRIPLIKGDSRQKIDLHWGKPDALGESDGKAVFGATNGYASVLHLGEEVKDEVGTVQSEDKGTSTTPGMIGLARHFPGGAGVFCGEQISGFPSGESSHSTEAWFRPAAVNTTVVGWGVEQGQGKVVMQMAGPPHVRMDCYFSGGTVGGSGKLPMGEWLHVVHTYQKGAARLYVNGVLDGGSDGGNPMKIPSPARMYIGGWYGNYNFVGDIDELRISTVARSADRVRLDYENQKSLQTLVGPVIRSGDAFSVSQTELTVAEGSSTTLTAEAGGALKVYWSLVRGGRETVVATDRLSFDFEAGRVTGDESATLRFKAICANGVKTKNIAITIKEGIPEPVFTLKAPAEWDGRTMIKVLPEITNLAAMQAGGVGELETEMLVSGLAVIKENVPGALILRRAQNSGLMTVTATVSNGGKPSTASATIRVTEPKNDAWVGREPANDEKPEDNQFYARDDKNQGTLHCNGKLGQPVDNLVLKLYADDKLAGTLEQKPSPGQTYAFAVKTQAGFDQIQGRAYSQDRCHRDDAASGRQPRLRRRLSHRRAVQRLGDRHPRAVPGGDP